MLKIRSILLILFCFPLILAGQESDFKLWTGLDLNYKFLKQAEAQLGIEARLDNNISRFDKAIFQPGISYKVNKKWDIDLQYRGWLEKYYNKESKYKQRSSLSGTYKLSYLKTKISLSTALQYGIPDIGNGESYSLNELVSRNSIKISKDILCEIIYSKNEVNIYDYVHTDNFAEKTILNNIWIWKLCGSTNL